MYLYIQQYYYFICSGINITMHGIGGTMASKFYLHASQKLFQFWTTNEMLWILIQHPTWQPEFMHKMTFMNCQFHNLVHYAVQNPLPLYTLYILYIILQVTFIMYCILNSRMVKQKVYFIYYLFRSVAQFCRLNGHDCTTLQGISVLSTYRQFEDQCLKFVNLSLPISWHSSWKKMSLTFLPVY